MKKGVRAIRAISIAALSLMVAVPLALYILLSTPWAQDKLRAAATAELSALLGSHVEVGAVEIHPFNRIDVRCVSVADDTGHPCLEVERVSARFELYHFLRTQRIMFDYALVDRPTLRVRRASDGAPLNVAGILSRLKGKDEKKESRLNLRVSTVALRDGRIYYDVLDVAPPDSGRFDARHIAVSGLQIHAALRCLSNEEIDIELDRLSFDERSGLRLQELSGRLCGDADGISVKELRLALPNSSLALDASYTHSGRRWHAGTDTAAPSVVYLPDLAPFSPLLAESYIGADIEFAAGGDSTSATLDHLRLATRDESLRVDAAAQAIGIGTAGEEVWLRSLDVRADAPRLCAHLRRFLPAKAKLLDRLALLGQSHVRLDGTLVERSLARISMHTATAIGSLDMHGNATSTDSFASARIKSDAELHDLSLGVVTRQPKLGKVSAMLTADGRLNKSGFDGSADLKQAQIQFNGRTCSGISATARIAPHSVGATLDIDDRAVQVDLTAEAAFAPHEPHTLRLEGDITNLDLNWLGLLDVYEGYTLNATIDTDLSGYSADDIEGRILLADIKFRNDNGDGVAINRLELNRDIHTRPAVVELMSDYVDGRIEGDLTPSGLASDVRRIAFALFPALAPDGYATATNEAECSNDFDFEVAVADAEQLSRFFRLPVQIIHPIEISGSMDCAAQLLQVSLDAPYLQQGDKIIDNTALFAQADGRAGTATVYATTHMPTKKGPMAAVLNVGASNNVVSTAIDWTIERTIPLNGTLSFDTRLHLGDDRLMAADVFFKPGTINFGDDVWNILPSHIAWSDGIAAVNGFALEAGNQRVAINGTASAGEEERLTVDIERLSLLPIFETLEINNALISGTATGTFEGRSLLSPAPFLTSEKLHVDSIGYNRCTLGRYADVRAAWNNERKSVDLDADIIGLDGLPSTIKGSITPASEELDLAFDVQHVPVAFMQPYMKAFASSVAGYASGKARLFGTFKYIDLTGDVFADSLALKIDFTNTEYFCSDSL
ncbi:MAG: hypothetical protein K2F77_04355, partial [Muribaculaceae bacterium]|nr:hypothetical protein [Muribaculaceae bacterium]